MGAPERSDPRRGESGTSLIELIVVVAIVTLAAGFGFEALAQRPAQARAGAVAFAGLVSEARALAAITGDEGVTGGSGATIGVVRTGDEYVATLYAYRPIAGALRAPIAVTNAAPFRTPTAIAIVQANRLIEPPFALFFSTSGHASAQAAFQVGVDAPLAAEPACPLQTGILIAFIDGVHNQAHALSCEIARLDLDTLMPVTASDAAP